MMVRVKSEEWCLALSKAGGELNDGMQADSSACRLCSHCCKA